MEVNPLICLGQGELARIYQGDITLICSAGMKSTEAVLISISNHSPRFSLINKAIAIVQKYLAGTLFVCYYPPVARK